MRKLKTKDVNLNLSVDKAAQETIIMKTILCEQSNKISESVIP